MEEWREKRNKAYKEGELPYSFTYKMRNAFIGERCPICGVRMGVGVKNDGIYFRTPIPTVQHNNPISKGGKHELSNISVICEKCNKTIQDEPTGRLNNDLVIQKWREINGRQN